MNRYCLGFAFSSDLKRVLLIEKKRPLFQAGLLNGIGGKLEEGESALDAMVREFNEETSLSINASGWLPLEPFGDESYQVEVFAAMAEIDTAQARTDEPLCVREIDALEANSFELVDGDLAQRIRRARAVLASTFPGAQ